MRLQTGKSRRNLTVVFEDLPGPQAKPAGPILDLRLMFWPWRICEAATESRLVLHRELIDIAQRNLNASFCLLRKLTETKNLGEIVELQAAHLGSRIAASIGQSEELATLSIKMALQFARDTYSSGLSNNDGQML